MKQLKQMKNKNLKQQKSRRRDDAETNNKEEEGKRYVNPDGGSPLYEDELTEEEKIIESDFKDKIKLSYKSGNRCFIESQQFVGYIILPNHKTAILVSIL